MRRAIATLACAAIVAGCAGSGPRWTLAPEATGGQATTTPAAATSPAPATPAPSTTPAPTPTPSIEGLPAVAALGGSGGLGVPGGLEPSADTVTETWYEGNSKYHAYYRSCFPEGGQYLTNEYTGFRTNNGVSPLVGDVYWAHIVVGVIGSSCAGGADVHTEVALPAGTSFGIGGGYTIHCFYTSPPKDDGTPGVTSEVTADSAAGCTQNPGIGVYGYSLGTRVVANGGIFEIVFPLVSTQALSGISDSSSTMTAYVQVTIATNDVAGDPLYGTAWTAPFQWVWVSANAPTIAYPSPSTTSIGSATAHSVANLYNHYTAGNAYFDIGTTTAYGTSDGPVAIGSGYNAAQVYEDWSGLAPNTTYHWRLRFVTAGGTTTGADQVFTTAADTTKPTAKAPTAAFTVGAQLGATAIPVKVSWPAATDNVSSGSALSYELQQRTYSGGAWSAWSTVVPWTTSRSSTRSLTPGSDAQQFRDHARDAAANVSNYASGTSFRLTAYQENASSSVLAYSGTWTRAALSGAYGGYAKWASAAGAKATLSFTGKAVAVVAPKRPDLGKADIYLDGVKKATIDLYNAAAQSRRIVWTMSFASSAAHTVELRVLGTKNASSSGTRVWVDVFATLR